MKTQQGFSLIEATMAVGVAAFCLTTLTGLVLTGLHSNEKSEDKCRALDVAAVVMSDLKSALKATGENKQTVDCLTLPEAGSNDTEQLIYYAEDADSGGNHFTLARSSNSRYRIAVSMVPPDSTLQHRATFVHIRITWPAQAATDMAYGSVEMASSLDRN